MEQPGLEPSPQQFQTMPGAMEAGLTPPPTVAEVPYGATVAQPTGMESGYDAGMPRRIEITAHEGEAQTLPVQTSQVGPMPETALPPQTQPETQRSSPRQEMLQRMEAAQDPNSLMMAVMEAEESGYFNGDVLYSLAQKEALKRGVTELAAKYLDRVTAEKNIQAAQLMHQAVSGNIEAASGMRVASDNMQTAARQMSDAIYRQGN